jgi:hypothetical protein
MSALEARYIPAQCCANAYINCRYYYKNLKLKLVFGSLGLNGHYEYGGVNWNVGDFDKNFGDFHCWLEDDEGNVYDYIFDFYNDISKLITRKKLRIVGTLEGFSKTTLEQNGLHYIVADKATQILLFMRYIPLMKAQEGLYKEAQQILCEKKQIKK